MIKITRFFAILLFSILSIQANADIPFEIAAHLDRIFLLKSVSREERLPQNLNYQQTSLIAVNLSNFMVKKFQSSILKNKNTFNRSELVDNIRTRIFQQLSDSTLANRPNFQYWIENHSSIKNLKNIYHIDIHGDIINIRYKNIDIPFRISRSEKTDPYFIMNLVGIPKSDRSKKKKSCLELAVSPRLQKSTIELLASAYASCPIPTDRQGDFLLTLAEDISRAMGLKAIDLVDDSSLYYEEHATHINIRRLRTFQKGQGWYESRGYNSVKPQPRPDKHLTTYALNDLTKDLENVPLRRNHDFLVSINFFMDAQNLNRELIEFNKENLSHLLKDFMVWLFNKDIVAYNKIDEFLFSDNTSVLDLEISQLDQDLPDLKKLLPQPDYLVQESWPVFSYDFYENEDEDNSYPPMSLCPWTNMRFGDGNISSSGQYMDLDYL